MDLLPGDHALDKWTFSDLGLPPLISGFLLTEDRYASLGSASILFLLLRWLRSFNLNSLLDVLEVLVVDQIIFFFSFVDLVIVEINSNIFFFFFKMSDQVMINEWIFFFNGRSLMTSFV
jgi:hypothetical protein